MLIASTPLFLACHGHFLFFLFKVWLLFFFLFAQCRFVLASFIYFCPAAGFSSYQLRIDCMLLCEETSSVLGMLKPKIKLVEEACQCKEP